MKKLLLILMTAVLALITLAGCNGQKAVVENGTIVMEGISVDFGGNNLTDKKSASLKTVKSVKTEKDNGLSSELYELTLDKPYTNPVTVSLPVPSEFSGKDNEALLLGIGVECEYDSGAKGIEYFYFPAEVDDKTANASFLPSDLSKATLYMGSSQGSATAIKNTVFTLGLFTSEIHYEDNGHFYLYYPTKVNGKFFYGIVGSDGLKDILYDLEATYEKFKALGYKYDESDFPMNVHIKKIEDEGSYHALFGDITLNVTNFKDKYVSGSLNPLLWHEFFHYVQGCYTGIFSSTEWIDEATSSYYEASANNLTYTSLTSQYYERQFISALPEDDSAADGYARSPLISFLVKKKGSEEWIKTLYENGGNKEAFISAAGEISGWSHDYYTALASGQVGFEGASIIYKNVKDGVYGPEVGASIKLAIPDENEQKQMQGEDEIILGSVSVAMQGQGSRFIAITVSADELKKLPDGVEPEVECEGAKITVLSLAGRNVNNCGKVLSKLKDSIDNNKVYLVVVTSKSAANVHGDFDIKIKMSNKKVDFSGTYKGVLNVIETDADIDVTTIVTFEKEFGDGSYYNIVCSNDETQSKYINGSYFVRANGEANIAGAVFQFSSDGMSFTASMMDFANKTWGTISAYK